MYVSKFVLVGILALAAASCGDKKKTDPLGPKAGVKDDAEVSCETSLYGLKYYTLSSNPYVIVDDKTALDNYSLPCIVLSQPGAVTTTYQCDDHPRIPNLIVQLHKVDGAYSTTSYDISVGTYRPTSNATCQIVK